MFDLSGHNQIGNSGGPPVDIFSPAIVQNVPSIPVDNGDAIVCRIDNGIAAGQNISLLLRVLLDDGRLIPFQYDFIAGANTATTSTFPLSRGLLISAICICTTGNQIPRGSLFCLLRVRYGGTQLFQSIFADYIGREITPSFPQSLINAPTSGAGTIRRFNVAGALPFTLVLNPTPQFRFKFLSFEGIIVAANLGGPRNFSISYQENGNNMLVGVSAVGLAVNSTNRCNVFPTAPLSTAVFANNQFTFPFDVSADNSNTVGNFQFVLDFITGTQAGDTITQGILSLETWVSL